MMPTPLAARTDRTRSGGPSSPNCHTQARWPLVIGRAPAADGARNVAAKPAASAPPAAAFRKFRRLQYEDVLDKALLRNAWCERTAVCLRLHPPKERRQGYGACDSRHAEPGGLTTRLPSQFRPGKTL